MKEKRSEDLILANEKLAFQNELKEKRAVELILANKKLAFENEEKEKRAAELILANEELAFQDKLKKKRAAELILANKELAFQNEEKKKRAGELMLVKEEINFQDEEKEKRAAELIIANKELAFQNEEKEKRAQELILANKELAFQNEEKEKRAQELILANKELASQKKELETIFNYTQDGIIVTDLEGNFLKSNKEFLKITGFSEEELLTKNCHLLTAPTDRKRNKQAVQKAIDTNNVVHIEKKYFLKDDKIVLVSMSISLLPDKKRLLLLVHDNTTLKLMQEQSKLAAMGEMIGNIAHQWRQPLSIISMGATGMKIQKEYGCLSDEMFYNECDAINMNAQYLSKTIDDFKNFIRGDRIKTLFSLKSEINSFLDLVKGTIKNNNISVLLELEDNIELNGYENELTQCFINIVNNAKDALVELDTKDRLIFIETTKTKNKVIIKIRDNGGGIDCKVLPKIFEPYFTTKHQTQGTGLGLHMSYNLIVDGMKGNIEAANVTFKYKDIKYKGAEFTIELPLS